MLQYVTQMRKTRKNIEGVTISRKGYTIEELFRNASFRKFAQYFLDQPRTIVKAEELSGVSRRTISEILESFKKDGEYDNKYIGWYGGSKGLKIKSRLLSDFASQILKLNPEESAVLDELITQDSIQRAVTNGNVTLDMALMKTLALTMAVAVINQVEIDDPLHKERTKYFRDALNTAYKKAPKRLMRDIKKILPKDGNIPLPFGLGSAKDEDVEPWLKDYMQRHRKTLEGTLIKMRSSTFPILTSLSDLYDTVVMRVGGVLFIKRQSELGSPDWIQQHMKFREEIKRKKKKGEQK